MACAARISASWAVPFRRPMARRRCRRPARKTSPTASCENDGSQITPPMNETRGNRFFVACMLLPPLLIVLAVVAFPLFYNAILSLSNANIYHIRDWRVIGFQQYAAVLGEPLFWSILVKTVIWTAVNVIFHVAIGLFLAVVL